MATPNPVQNSGAAQEPELEAVPNTWPGGFGIYKYSKAAVKFNLGSTVTLLIAYIVLYAIVEALFGQKENTKYLASLIELLISSVFMPAILLVLFADVERKKMSFGEAFTQGMPFVLRYFVQSILISIISLLSLVALIVPYFFIVPRLILAPYYLVGQNMGIMDSIRKSWDDTKGQLGKIYGLIGVLIVIFLPIITIIGIPFSIYFGLMFSAAFTLLYTYLNQTSTTGQKPNDQA